jgi:hypothetical protein
VSSTGDTVRSDRLAKLLQDKGRRQGHTACSLSLVSVYAMTSCLRIISLITLVLAASPAFAGEKMKDAKETEAPVGAADATSVLGDIQQGWTSQNADLILRHFGTNKVAIDIDGSGLAGSFSKDQGFYLFKELFKTTVTKKFTFVQIRSSNEDGTASFAIAERRYQRKDDGRQVKDKVYIALHVEQDDSGRWVLDEIKSIR